MCTLMTKARHSGLIVGRCIGRPWWRSERAASGIVGWPRRPAWLCRISSRARVARLDPPGGQEPRTNCPQDRSPTTSDARGLLGRSRHPPLRGYNSLVHRHGLSCGGCLKQVPNPCANCSTAFPKATELPNPDYRDGSVQVKRWGTQYFHGIDSPGWATRCLGEGRRTVGTRVSALV